MNNIEDVLKLTKEQIKQLSEAEKSQVRAILEAEIEKIMQRNKK
jgi:hypothetical protein